MAAKFISDQYNTLWLNCHQRELTSEFDPECVVQRTRDILALYSVLSQDLW
jgi:hypothetical protein